jgi:hypothetical protein
MPQAAIPAIQIPEAIQSSGPPQWDPYDPTGSLQRLFTEGGKGVLRRMVTLLGLDDPNQVLAFGTPLQDVPMQGGMLEALAQKFPRFANALATYRSPTVHATSPSWATAQGVLREVETPPTAQALKTAATAAKNRARVQVRLGEAPTEQAGESLLISTRVPTAVEAPRSAPGDPLLLTNLDVVKEDPELVAKFAARIRTYPQLTEKEAALNDQGVIDAFMDRGQKNLQWLWDQTPPETRERSRLWYVGGNRIGGEMAAETAIQPAQAYAVIASQSPQKEWFNNVEIARRINSGYKELWQVNPVVTPDIWQLFHAKTLQSLQDKFRTLANSEGPGVAYELQRRIEAKIAQDGRRFIGQRFQDLPLDGQSRVLRTISEASTSPHYPVITPEGRNAGLAMTEGPNPRPKGLQWNSYDMIENALSVLQDGSAENISRRMGSQHKVRSFYNNLSNPFDPRSLTVDTQQVAATHLQPFSQEAPEVGFVMSGPASAHTGISGANPIYGDIGKRLGAANEIVPAQGQSVVWETGRGLFKPEQKRSDLPKIVEQLWHDFRTGRITEAQFYDHLLNASGGIAPPAWKSR